MSRTCADCRNAKPNSEFTSSQLVKNSARCRSCVSNRNRKYNSENRERVNIKRKAYYEANKEHLLAQAKDRWEERKHLYEPARQAWAEVNRDRMLEYQRNRGVEFRQWIDEKKSGSPCLDCGGEFEPFVMEYDHIEGEKRHSICNMANHRRERVLEEIAKCELVCCNCHRIRSHARRSEPTTPRLIEFRSWLNELKAAPCMDCGETFAPEAMDFDHVRGVKVKGVTDMWSWSRDKVLKEIEKCELVCANCHRVRSVTALREVA